MRNFLFTVHFVIIVKRYLHVPLKMAIDVSQMLFTTVKNMRYIRDIADTHDLEYLSELEDLTMLYIVEHAYEIGAQARAYHYMPKYVHNFIMVHEKHYNTLPMEFVAMMFFGKYEDDVIPSTGSQSEYLKLPGYFKRCPAITKSWIRENKAIVRCLDTDLLYEFLPYAVTIYGVEIIHTVPPENITLEVLERTADEIDVPVTELISLTNDMARREELSRKESASE